MCLNIRRNGQAQQFEVSKRREEKIGRYEEEREATQQSTLQHKKHQSEREEENLQGK